MDKGIEELKTIDYFFWYGQASLDEETKHDVVLGLLQPARSLFYDRQDGAGIVDLENAPGSLSLTIGAKYRVSSWAGRRNREVSNGTDGYPDRRIALSQSTVAVSSPRRGEVDIAVLYIPLADYRIAVRITAPASLGG